MTYGTPAHSRPRKPAARGRRPRAAAYAPVDVAIVCESTYPYLTGGLSAVVHQICVANPNRSVGIIHIAWDSDSPIVPKYEVPPQVAWVKVVHQSMREHRRDFLDLRPRSARLGRKATKAVVDRLFAALDDHLKGDDEGLWSLYDDGINPMTRSFRLWPVISSAAFMTRAREYFSRAGLSFTALFWELREFFSLAFAVTDLVLPKAAVYHAHTTGAAALLAAAGARQHGTTFLLTEHNLYARDTINHLLERSMDTPVTRDEWRTLDHYLTSAMEPEQTRVTPRQRAWMAWWTHTGLVAYRSADLITYLYPDAIEEAAALGGDPAKSIVLANGVTPSDFDDARGVFDARRATTRGSGADRIWRLAYAARVVPIKGLLDLLEALARLVADGVENWELDVMGPDEEMPDYAARCRSRCHELGLDGHVKFFGSVNLRERFGNYDALVLPSHNEGQPIVVLEAMTIGLPTIGTYVGGMKQLVEDPIVVDSNDIMTGVVDSCGLLVDAHDVGGMTEAIKQLMADEALFDRLSVNARARVEHYFHIDTAMALYRAVYRRFGSVPEAEFLEQLPLPLPITGQPLPEVRPASVPRSPARRAA
ncbi:MAG: GT4 family glycosyltransferase PelF [Acidobacteria bacterium]|nr:GT4 family glycosyltransferase PelF [Acidobacteriota bacterium]